MRVSGFRAGGLRVWGSGIWVWAPGGPAVWSVG